MSAVQELERARRAGQEAQRLMSEAALQQQMAKATEDKARRDAERAKAESEAASRELAAWNPETLTLIKELDAELKATLRARKPLGYRGREVRASCRQFLYGATDDSSLAPGEFFVSLFAKVNDPFLSSIKSLRDKLGVVAAREGVDHGLAVELDRLECATWAALTSRLREAAGELG